MNKICSLLGLALKAGRLVSGEDAVREGIRQNKVKLTIITTDASDNTKKRFVNSASFYNVEYILWGQKELLGQCLGKSARSVLGITDEGFSKKIKELIAIEGNGEKNPGGELFEQDTHI